MTIYILTFFRKSKLSTLFLQFVGYYSQTVSAGITHSPSLWKVAYWIPRYLQGLRNTRTLVSSCLCLFLHPLNSNHSPSPTASPLWTLVEPLLLFHIHSCSLGLGHSHLSPVLVHQPLTLILPVQPSQKLSPDHITAQQNTLPWLSKCPQKKVLIPWHDPADPSGSTS